MGLNRIDFLRPVAVPRIGWILLALGGMALGAALWLDQQWASERIEVRRAQLAAVAEQQAKMKPVRASAPTLEQRRARQVQAELQRPWLPVLRAVESAAVAPVYLLSLNVDPLTGQVKLEGEAPSFDHALAFVQVLDVGGALQPASLLSHAETPSPQGDKPWVKFSATTQWSLR